MTQANASKCFDFIAAAADDVDDVEDIALLSRVRSKSFVKQSAEQERGYGEKHKRF